MDTQTKLFVGLGNPGVKYAGNRHNIGFMAVDQLADHYSASPFKSKFQGQICDINVEGHKVYLLKPETYMNESGRSVQAAAQFYKISPENIIVFYDELDLPVFKVKVKKGGGSGGHNGIKSIDAYLPSKEYWRVRMGIDHPGHRGRVTSYVLSDFSKKEQSVTEDFLYDNAKHLPYLVQNNENDYMTYMSERAKHYGI